MGTQIGSLGVVGGNITLQSGGNISVENDSENVILGDATFIGSSRTSSLLEPSELQQAGDIDITAVSFSLSNKGVAALISNSSSGANIQPGDINLNIQDTVTIDGVNAFVGNISSGDNIGINGDINIKVSGATNIEIPSAGSPVNGIFSFLSEDSTGRSGNISLDTGSLTLKGGSQVSSGNFGQGDGGDITIQAEDKIHLEGGANVNAEISEEDNFGGIELSGNFSPTVVVSAAVSQEGLSNGGNIEISAGSLEIIDGAQIVSSAITQGQGNAGNIDINVREAITLSGTTSAIANDVPIDASSVIFSFLGLTTFAGTGEAIGNTGKIDIKANSLSLSDRVGISTSTAARGNAGNIALQIDDSISLSQGSLIVSSVSPGGSGQSGDIDIQTHTLNLTDGSTIFAGLEEAGLGLPAATGQAGNITIKATDYINISGFNPDTFTLIFPFNPSETLEVGLESSGIFVGAAEGTTGNPGTITLETVALRLADGGVIQASTANDSNAGDIRINANSFEAINGGQILAITESSGNGGNINLSIADDITITGSDSSFAQRIAQLPDNVINQGAESAVLALTTAEATGDGGNITINSSELNVLDNGRVAVDSQGQGNGGIVSITADDLTLNGEASITSSTTAGEGGEIFLTIDDNLTLRNNSTINAQAFGTANGGNIDIEADFIIAFPSQFDGNDILASASAGRGGNINITAETLFGIEERPQNPLTNDIDASSEFGLDGDVLISNPDTNIRQIDTEIPKNIVEPETLGINACSGGGETEASSFTIKGKGGIPPQPTEPFMADALIPDGKPITIDKETDVNSLLVEERETKQRDVNYDPNYIPPDIKPIETSMGDIYPARGIIKTEDGEIILTVYPTDNINTRTPHKSANCTP